MSLTFWRTLAYTFIFTSLLFFGFLFGAYVFAINTESLITDISIATRQQIVLENRGQYEYIAPVCDTFGCYTVNHIEKWNGDIIPERVGYEVIYVRNDGAIKTEATNGFNYLNTDWTEPTKATTTL